VATQKPPYLPAALLALFALLHPIANVFGQATSVQARISSVTLPALLSAGTGPGHTPARGEALSPGVEIDTRGGGQVAILLSDGSLVVVLPGSQVVLKDYRSASSARELFDILVGYVRVKVSHYGGRPNPYRINSPSASIAVRGTDFTVAVAPTGETQVIVYEGLVEVSSRANPLDEMLVQPGSGVRVIPGRELRLFTPVPGHDLAFSAEGNDSHSAQQDRGVLGSDRAIDNDESQRVEAGIYQTHLSNLASGAQTPFLMRFLAFSDSHLDSAENPAYATEFKAAQGRLWGVSSLQNSALAGIAAEGLVIDNPINYNIAPHLSFLAPLPVRGIVMGGSLDGFRDGVKASTVENGVPLAGPPFSPSSVGRSAVAFSSRASLFSGTFVAAKHIGNTSVGLSLSRTEVRGNLNSIIDQEKRELTSNEQIQTRSLIHQTQFGFGITREFASGHKLGLRYEYGRISGSNYDQSRILNGVLQRPDQTQTAGHLSELGFRLRGPVARRIFYGVEASVTGVRMDDSLLRTLSADAHQHTQAARWAAGAGVGWIVTPRVTLSFDLAYGDGRVALRRFEDATGNVLEDNRQNTKFATVHSAIQVNLWRKLFASASLLALGKKDSSSLTLFADQLGQVTTSDGLALPSGMTTDRTISRYSQFGLGWTFSNDLIAQYVVSTDFGVSAPSHVLLLRYTFRPRKK
jgi:hypothetical protein